MKRGRKTLDEIREILDDHRDEIRRRFGITDIAVFGSYIRGEQKRGSDIDILASFEDTVSLLTLAGAQVYLGEILSMKVDMVPREDIRPELKDTITREAVPV